MTLWLVAVGFVTLLGQVVLLREVLVASFGSELIYILAIGLQLVGTAIGVMAGRRTTRAPDATIRALFLLFAALLPVLVVLARATRTIFGGTPGAYLPFHHQLAGIALVLLPAGVIGGLLFTRAARLFVDGGRTLALAYAVESAGGLAGGAISTVLIALGARNLVAALVCSVVAIVVAIVPHRRGRPRWVAPVVCALAVLVAAGLVFSRRIDLRLTAIDHPRLIDSRDTPYGRATVTGSLGQIVVFENDSLAFESQGTSAEELVHVSALEVASPRRVLVLGGALEGAVPEIVKHHPERIDDVELDRRLVETVEPHLPKRLTRWTSRPDTTLIFDDPRRFLRRPARYDLILSAMPEPESGQASRFYTREFFELCARRLAPGGAVAFRLRSSENLWTTALTRRTASIVTALGSVFADVVVLPGNVNVVIASQQPLERDPAILEKRFIERGIETRLVSPRYLRYLYTNDRLAEIERSLGKTPAPANTDARPVCYQQTLVLWLSRFFPTIAQKDLAIFDPDALRGVSSRWIVVFAVAAIALLMACRRSASLGRTLLVAIAGFIGMVLEGALILGYQMKEGVLYQDLGLLLTSFMCGLAIGSGVIDRIGRRATERGGLSWRIGVGILLATAALAAVIAWSFSWSGGTGPWLPMALLVAAGTLTGAIFAYASLRRVEDQSSAVAPLYAADLVGGCAGSLAGSLFLLPILGLPASALWVGGLALLAIVLV